MSISEKLNKIPRFLPGAVAFEIISQTPNQEFTFSETSGCSGNRNFCPGTGTAPDRHLGVTFGFYCTHPHIHITMACTWRNSLGPLIRRCAFLESLGVPPRMVPSRVDGLQVEEEGEERRGMGGEGGGRRSVGMRKKVGRGSGLRRWGGGWMSEEDGCGTWLRWWITCRTAARRTPHPPSV